MASNFIKSLLFIPLLLSSAEANEIEPPTTEQLIYMETVNYRLNQLHLLSLILQELQAIRCQTEDSDYCQQINHDTEEQE